MIFCAESLGNLFLRNGEKNFRKDSGTRHTSNYQATIRVMYERTWKAKPKPTRQLSETRETSVLVLTSQDVTT